MAKQPTRAKDQGVSTKRLRRQAAIRIDRMQRAVMAIKQSWMETDDPLLDSALDAIHAAIERFESELAEIADYLDEPSEVVG